MRGNLEHPSDKFVEATIEILFKNSRAVSDKELVNSVCIKLPHKLMVVAAFDSNGTEENMDLNRKHGSVFAVRLKIHHASSERWFILSETHFVRN